MSAQRGAAVHTRPCRYCGATVMTFQDELGCQRYLQTAEPTVTTVLPDLHTWELSPYRSVGWHLLDFPQRTTQPLRLEHLCEGNAQRLAGKVVQR